MSYLIMNNDGVMDGPFETYMDALNLLKAEKLDGNLKPWNVRIVKDMGTFDTYITSDQEVPFTDQMSEEFKSAMRMYDSIIKDDITSSDIYGQRKVGGRRYVVASNMMLNVHTDADGDVESASLTVLGFGNHIELPIEKEEALSVIDRIHSDNFSNNCVGY